MRWPRRPQPPITRAEGMGVRVRDIVGGMGMERKGNGKVEGKGVLWLLYICLRRCWY